MYDTHTQARITTTIIFGKSWCWHWHRVECVRLANSVEDFPLVIYHITHHAVSLSDARDSRFDSRLESNRFDTRFRLEQILNKLPSSPPLGSILLPGPRGPVPPYPNPSSPQGPIPTPIPVPIPPCHIPPQTIPPHPRAQPLSLPQMALVGKK